MQNSQTALVRHVRHQYSASAGVHELGYEVVAGGSVDDAVVSRFFKLPAAS